MTEVGGNCIMEELHNLYSPLDVVRGISQGRLDGRGM